MNIHYRQGVHGDSKAIAELFTLAYPAGIHELTDIDYDGEYSSLDILHHILCLNRGNASCENAMVAEIDGVIIAMAYSVSPLFCDITSELDLGIQKVIKKQTRIGINNLFNSEFIGACCLKAFAVLPRFRRRGIGSELLKLTKEKIKRNGYKNLCNFVYNENEDALSVYFKNGFAVLYEEQVPPVFALECNI